jgi:putative sterol carrier protein
MSDDTPRYWTPAFVERFVEAINGDDEFQDTAGSFSETVELRCLDTPDGEDVSATYTFEDGQIVDVDLWIDDAPSEQMREEPVDKDAVMVRATAPYDVWVKMDKGEMGSTEALASPDYQIEGAMMRIMSNMGVFRGMNKVSAHVEKSY